jgi:hypothetical protein
VAIISINLFAAGLEGLLFVVLLRFSLDEFADFSYLS